MTLHVAVRGIVKFEAFRFPRTAMLTDTLATLSTQGTISLSSATLRHLPLAREAIADLGRWGDPVTATYNPHHEHLWRGRHHRRAPL